jgi:hypothetical protein
MQGQTDATSFRIPADPRQTTTGYVVLTTSGRNYIFTDRPAALPALSVASAAAVRWHREFTGNGWEDHSQVPSEPTGNLTVQISAVNLQTARAAHSDVLANHGAGGSTAQAFRDASLRRYLGAVTKDKPENPCASRPRAAWTNHQSSFRFVMQTLLGALKSTGISADGIAHRCGGADPGSARNLRRHGRTGPSDQALPSFPPWRIWFGAGSL